MKVKIVSSQSISVKVLNKNVGEILSAIEKKAGKTVSLEDVTLSDGSANYTDTSMSEIVSLSDEDVIKKILPLIREKTGKTAKSLNTSKISIVKESLTK